MCNDPVLTISARNDPVLMILVSFTCAEALRRGVPFAMLVPNTLVDHICVLKDGTIDKTLEELVAKALISLHRDGYLSKVVRPGCQAILGRSL